jgi:adenylate kinase
MNILFLGPQGSGKGTQAHLLKEKLNLQYLDMGAFLRETAKTHPEVEERLGKGELLSDELVISLVKEYLDKNNLYDGLVYDGFPRRVPQLHALQQILNEQGKKLNYTVYLSIPEEETVRRLSARRIHKTTGEIYNLITNPPGDDINEEDLLHRSDDQPEAIRERLREYHSYTEPLLEELRKTTTFIEIDGTQSIESIHQEIYKALSEYEQGNS